MANQSLTITVRSPKTQLQLAREVKAASDPRGQCRVLARFFNRAACGLETINFDVQLGANAVRATGTVTLTYASISASDTVTVNGTVLTCVDTGTPTAAQFKKITSLAVTAANLAAAINANATTKLVVSATSALGVVTVNAVEAGEAGNGITLATNNGTGFGVSAATLASGAGGPDQAPVTFSRGL